MNVNQMKELEYKLFEAYADQAGDCSFMQWLMYIRNDPEDLWQRIVSEYLNWVVENETEAFLSK